MDVPADDQPSRAGDRAPRLDTMCSHSHAFNPVAKTPSRLNLRTIGALGGRGSHGAGSVTGLTAGTMRADRLATLAVLTRPQRDTWDVTHKAALRDITAARDLCDRHY
jgi:hypothetical protein